MRRLSHLLSVAGLLLALTLFFNSAVVAASTNTCDEHVIFDKCIALFDPGVRIDPQSVSSCKTVSKLSCSRQASNPVKTNSGTGGQHLFLGADSLDNPYPGFTRSTPGQSLGASIGYTDNDYVQKLVTGKTSSTVSTSKTINFTIGGMGTYAWDQYKVSDSLYFVPAVWIYAKGTWDQPTKNIGEISALELGPKAEFQISGTGENPYINYLELAPYYQTDFYGRAQAEGFSASWTPVNANYFLGAVNPAYKPYLVDGFLELRAESAVLNVTDPGYTYLTRHTYAWLGGAARAYLFLFPTGTGSWGPYLTDRVSLVGTVQSYWDANSSKVATMYSAALQYKLTCNTKSTGPSATPNQADKDPQSCDGGSTSLSLQYNYGRDRDTLQVQQLLTTKLTFAF